MDGMNLALLRVMPWAAPRMSCEAASIANRLLRRRQQIRIGRLTLGFGNATAAAADAMTFALRVGAETGRLTAPTELVRRLLATLDRAASEAQGAAACLLLELALEPALQGLERRFPELSLTLLPGCDQTSDGIVFGLTCAMNDAHFVVHIELPPRAAEHLANALDMLPLHRQRNPRLPIPLAVRCGAATLPLADLRSLRIGDAVLPELLDPAEPLLIAGEYCCWPARRDANALTVTSARQILQETSRMSATAITSEDPVPLGELPIRLTFEFGRLELTLAEIEALGPGHVFPLGRDERQPVDILANGKRVGLGDIVKVGDTLGVRILRFGDA